MHLSRINILAEMFPTREAYPFNLSVLQQTPEINLEYPVTFFVGENGTGKSTLLQAIADRCGIHRWQGFERTRSSFNVYEDKLYRAINVTWTNDSVPGSYFCSQCFQEFAKLLDQWASNDQGLLNYFGVQSLMTQSHGQVLMAFFKSRYERKGLYLLDEPETALSPKSQLELIKVITEVTRDCDAQFLVVTHSPILLACPNAMIYSLDKIPIQRISYEQTEYYQFYRAFMNNRDQFLEDL